MDVHRMIAERFNLCLFACIWLLEDAMTVILGRPGDLGIVQVIGSGFNILLGLG